MLLKLSSYSIFYILIVWTVGTCYGFVLLSSAAGHNADIKLFVPGEELIYNLQTTLLLNEKNENSKNVGFIVSAQVVVQTIWGQNNEKVLKFKIDNPKLQIKSRKAPSPDGFVYHTSKLQEFTNKPYYVHWNNGKITKILVNKKEPTSLVNLKKGVASLFQFQLLDGTIEEIDASGTCSVQYTSPNQHKILKTKKNCLSSDLPYLRNPEITLDAIVTSSRNIDYEFSSNYQYFKTIKSHEEHVMSVSSNNEFGNQIKSEQILEYVEATPNKVPTLSFKTVEEVLNELVPSENLSEESLRTEKENIPNDENKVFFDTVTELRDQLSSNLLGGAGPAKAFVKLVHVARTAKKEDLKKTLNSKKNVKILPQLLDVLGSSPTQAGYEAVMAKLDFTKEDQTDLCERYLWSLSLGAHPNLDTVDKLFVKYKKSTDIPPKLNETLLLTLSSMSYRLGVAAQPKGEKVFQKLEKLILEKLRVSKPEESFAYLRALKNLRSPTTIPDLLKKIKKGTTKEGALAWKAIRSFDRKYWTPEILKAARLAFLQLDRRYDSSSRAIASEILLDAPDDQTLKEIIYHLASNDTAYEVKQYTLQNIKMLSEHDVSLRRRVEKIIKSDKKINNYSSLSPKGFSTAIRRHFVKNPSGNGSLVSLQEINNAVVKRGVININWDKEAGTSELFTLGIFTSGLTSFLSSDNEESDEEPESPSAGMELTVLGTQLRPFVFFNSQGELMGHVWSGTASERTTAYQALIMLQDHLEYLRLGSGFIVELDLKGAVSFDLAGKVEISIWGRSAESLVEKCAGIFVTGVMKLDTSFVTSKVEFTVSLEPKLKLLSDIDFSANMRFCMRLSQLDVVLKHNIYKIERIPGSKHKLRISKYRKTATPGKTYALNRKNNEMCNAIHH